MYMHVDTVHMYMYMFCTSQCLPHRHVDVKKIHPNHSDLQKLTKNVTHGKKISDTPPMGLEPTTFELEVQRASIAPRGLYRGDDAQSELKYQTLLSIESPPPISRLLSH